MRLLRRFTLTRVWLSFDSELRFYFFSLSLSLSLFLLSFALRRLTISFQNRKSCRENIFKTEIVIVTDKRTRYAVETERIDSGGSWDHELEPAILLTIGL